MFQKKRNTFHGGVHPYEGKELSKDKPIVKAQPGNLLYYAVSQHIGAPAVPIVQKGDHVKAGQKIAEAGGFVSTLFLLSQCFLNFLSKRNRWHCAHPLYS